MRSKITPILILFLAINARAQTSVAPNALWTCELDCGVSNHAQTQRPSSTGIIADIKKSMARNSFFKNFFFPIGYKVPIGPHTFTSSTIPATDHHRCNSSGDTAEQAMKSLEAHITGVGLSVVALRCDQCSVDQLVGAFCNEARSKVTLPYSVLKSRLNSNLAEADQSASSAK
jgi:hypothetical protein